MSWPTRITQLLQKAAQGDRSVENELYELVYERLHQIAQNKFHSERAGHTLQATELVDEAYMSLIRAEGMAWSNRQHFFAVASRVMRQILIDYARKRNAQKRPRPDFRVPVEAAQVFALDDTEFLVALDQALTRLEKVSVRACKVVEMRTFGGLSIEAIASSLGVSSRTAKRDWQTARVWLYKDLYGGDAGSEQQVG